MWRMCGRPIRLPTAFRRWGADAASARRALALRVLLAVGLCAACVSPAAGADPMSLAEAVKAGLVRFEIKGLGGSTGDAIEIVAQRQGSNTLRLALDAGTVFENRSASVQRMAAFGIKGERVGANTYRPSTVMVLADDRAKRFIVEAYCLDFDRDNPVDGSGFTLAPVDARAARLLSAGHAASANPEAIQCALWLMGGGVSESDLRRRFPASEQDVAAARRLLQQVRGTEPALKPERGQ